MTKKMTPEDYKPYRALLLNILEHLEDDIEELQSETSQACRRAREVSSEDMGEEVLAVEFSFELMEKDENTVREVLGALERIDEERYGRCEYCNRWIRRTRLKALPQARNCIDCQRSQELEQKA